MVEITSYIVALLSMIVLSIVLGWILGHYSEG
jgi:hypothetical protein